MIAGQYNFIIQQGSTFALTFTYEDQDEVVIDLTGYTARLKAKVDYSQTSAVIDLTTSNGGITLGGAAGTIALAMTAAATAALTAPQTLYYDLELILGSTVDRIIQGTIEISPEVTN